MAVVQTQIGDFVAELTQETVRRLSAQITPHRVEGRADIVDHIRVNPEVVDVRGVISATPLDGSDDSRDRLQAAYDALPRLLGQPVTLVTDLMVIETMGVASLTLPQTPDTGDAIPFQMTLIELNLTETQTVDIPPEAPPPARRAAAASTVDRGSQTGTDSTAADEGQVSSILATLFGS